MRIARCAGRGTKARCADAPVMGSVIVCWAWFRLTARCAGVIHVLGVVPTERPLCRRGTVQVWSAHAAGNPSDRDRSAEHVVAADRFAREIVGFLTGSSGALAAAELHRWAAIIALLFCELHLAV